MNARTLLVSLSAAVSLWDASSASALDAARISGKVLILAAASTTDAIDEIRLEFTRRHTEVTVRTSFAASNALAQQINAGAEADVFLSASSEWADFLEKRNLVARRLDLLGNRLVVIVPAGSKLRIAGAGDLVSGGIQRLALADPQAVPAGVYARAALEKLGLWKQLERRVAGAADVRQAVKFVEVGAADAGIVYATDTAGNDKVRVVLTLPAELSDSIRYPLVLLKRAEKDAAAVALYEFLRSPAAAAVFRRHGFIVLSQGASADPPTR
jgi:molybdate transport system substrate-binding protein